VISLSRVRQKPLHGIDRLPYFVQSHPSGSLLTLAGVAQRSEPIFKIKHQTSDIKSANGRIDLLAPAPLKLVRVPRSLAATPAALPSMSLFPKLHSASRL